MKKYLLVVLFCFSFYSFGYDRVNKYPKFIEYPKVRRITFLAPDGQSYLFLAEYWYRRRKMRLFSNNWKPHSSDGAECQGLDGKTYSFSDLDVDLNGEVSGEEWENFQPPPDFGVDIDGDGWADRLEKKLGMETDKWNAEPPSNKLMSLDTDRASPENIEIGSEVVDRYTAQVLGHLVYGEGKSGLQVLGVRDYDGNFWSFEDYDLGRLWIPSDGSGDLVVLDHPNGQSYPSDGSNSNSGDSGSGGSSGSGGGSGGGNGFKPPSQNEVTNPIGNVDDELPDTIDNPDDSQSTELLNRILEVNNIQAGYMGKLGEHLSKQVYDQSNKINDSNDLLSNINNNANINADNIVDAINDLSDSLLGEEEPSGNPSLSAFLNGAFSKSGKFSKFKSKLPLPTVSGSSSEILFELPAVDIGEHQLKAIAGDYSFMSSTLSVIRVALIIVIHFLSFMKIIDYVGSIFRMSGV